MTNPLQNPIICTPINAFEDNYIWALQHKNHLVVVDPGQAAPVLQYLRQHTLKLTAILITHHHYDHTAGIAGLLQAFPGIPVYGPNSQRIPAISVHCVEAQTIQPSGLPFELTVLAVPGHTADHIAYYTEQTADPWLFCGDTLFAVGCGKVFDGTMEQLYHSLQRLKQLPQNTLIYCTHEYTVANIEFALQVEPQNPALRQRAAEVAQTRLRAQPTLPSNLALECATNPFLRCDTQAVQKAVSEYAGRDLNNDPAAVFSVLRTWKD